MTRDIATEIGDNWSVFFFQTSRVAAKRVIVDLFRYVQKIKEASLPHFMIREFVATRSIGVSLRVLRSKGNAKLVDGKLVRFFDRNDLHYKKEPEGNRHAWLAKGTRNANWNRQRCEFLHQLSSLVVFLAENDIFEARDKCLSAHYFVNMLGLQEATVSGTNQVHFFDTVSGEAYRFQTLQLPNIQNTIN